MANAVVTLMLVALMLTGVAVMARGSFTSVDLLAEAWSRMEARSGDIARTELEVVSTSRNAQMVDVVLRNAGQTGLRDFEEWDVIIQYYQASGTYYQVWLPYAESDPPGNNQWTVEGIYVDAAAAEAERFQPGIVDPDEEVKVRIKLSPAARTEANQAIIGTANGVSISTLF